MTARRILLTGSSGLVGTSLIRVLERDRISTVSLFRRKISEPGRREAQTATWDPFAPTPMDAPETLNGVDGAVHLSGANLSGHRWTTKFKKEILDSRVKPTHALALLLAGLRPKPSVLVCASAIGIYGDRADEVLSEKSASGSGFLPDVCVAWERAAQPALDAGIRVVHARFGIVLSPDGGALKQMLPLFRLGLGGPLGNGSQWMSWVALPDVCQAILFALQTESLSGAINVVAPQPVTNADFTHTLGGVLHRPALLPAPAPALRLVFGEMAGATILSSERVLPERLQAAGFVFKYPDLESGLRAVLAT